MSKLSQQKTMKTNSYPFKVWHEKWININTITYFTVFPFLLFGFAFILDQKFPLGLSWSPVISFCATFFFIILMIFVTYFINKFIFYLFMLPKKKEDKLLYEQYLAEKKKPSNLNINNSLKALSRLVKQVFGGIFIFLLFLGCILLAFHLLFHFTLIVIAITLIVIMIMLAIKFFGD